MTKTKTMKKITSTLRILQELLQAFCRHYLLDNFSEMVLAYCSTLIIELQRKDLKILRLVTMKSGLMTIPLSLLLTECISLVLNLIMAAGNHTAYRIPLPFCHSLTEHFYFSFVLSTAVGGMAHSSVSLAIINITDPLNIHSVNGRWQYDSRFYTFLCYFLNAYVQDFFFN